MAFRLNKEPCPSCKGKKIQNDLLCKYCVGRGYIGTMEEIEEPKDSLKQDKERKKRRGRRRKSELTELPTD